MDLGNGLGHLTYSTLVHPGDTWDDMWTSLTTYVPKVQKRVCPNAPFGVSLQKLVDAGIPIFKLQEAAAMRVPNVTQKIVDTLHRYAKTIYLTQTVEKKDGKLNRFLNLEDAFRAWETDPGPREWRTHFHVPVFLDDLGEFGTTRFAIEDALKFHKAKPLSRQLEIETYTWDVLPDHLKTGDIVDYVSREIEWVRGQLQ